MGERAPFGRAHWARRIRGAACARQPDTNAASWLLAGTGGFHWAPFHCCALVVVRGARSSPKATRRRRLDARLGRGGPSELAAGRAG